MPTLIPLLTEFEKEHISERQALPEKYLGLPDAEMDARIAEARRTQQPSTQGRPAGAIEKGVCDS